MGRGKLRIYLGAAPGVGKTYAMLSEGHRRVERGTDLVVGFVEHHGRPRTEVMMRGLEEVGRRELEYRGTTFTEMDVDAVLGRAPAVAIIDELAHTNVPGCRNAKRWQDIEELLKAGIDVISTVNIQHLESLGDVVESITGVRQRETVPDEVVRRADQIELVDMSPQALRRRMAHGNIYAPDKVDAALSNYFRPGNLTALRELALLWTADRVDEYLQQYRDEHSIRSTWQARERIVVGLTGGPEGRTLIRRAARMAAKGSGSEILAVYIARSDGLTSASRRSWRSSAPWSRTWAAPSTTSSATTSPPRCWSSRAASTPPRSCSVPVVGVRGSTCSGRASVPPSPGNPARTSTCTSSPMTRSARAAGSPSPAERGSAVHGSSRAGRSVL
ncbi:hypothetical protein SVIO_065430 [Streptomyces violaceusniger]|uniref:Signal transduction histidine kinase osmosensitive K+ channel sensor N-terminal domain-containing protein n=1 Tax=Streptomyces violaceusniger TaxID=68280 RepID=A0A4D4LA63_STRVO|nr:hypothetical protein SVIO_065430 [Streptomyces violaceusniger]